MACEKCGHIIERPDLPHVTRQCDACGRELHIHERGEHGIGFKIAKGDTVVIPASFLRPSFNPLKSNAQFSRFGLTWFAEQVHLEDLPKKKGQMMSELDRLDEIAMKVLKESPLLARLDLQNEQDCDRAFELVKQNPDSAEWCAYRMEIFINWTKEAVENNDIQEAIWAMGCLERVRSMLLFKQQLEEVVWMGQSAKRIIDILRVWDAEKTNSDEGFWQITFKENAYAISQVFAIPLIFIKDAAYVGGMNVNRANAKLVDYLFSLESSREAVLVEIKTPCTKLLGSPYRGTFCPSKELSGAVAQVLDYRRSLVKDYTSIVEGSGHQLTAFMPKCAIIIGNGSKELDSNAKRRAFEDFRANSRDVEIVTYDELFRKLEVLASLFGLKRTQGTA